MKKIPLTKGKFALVDDEDYEHLMQWNWHFHRSGYAVRSEYLGKTSEGKYRSAHVTMHRTINKTPEGMHTDHINGDKLDNRSGNLRIASATQNTQNKKKRSDKTSSKYKGVSLRKQGHKWKSYIRVNGKLIVLGVFGREEDAATAYNFAALEHFGEFAKLNTAGGCH